MAVEYLKRAAPRPAEETASLSAAVQAMLEEIEAGGEAAARAHAARLDGYEGPLLLNRDAIAAAAADVPARLKDDIRYAWDNIRRFAEAQRQAVRDIEVELAPGLAAGQRAIPVGAAGCYVPGGAMLMLLPR